MPAAASTKNRLAGGSAVNHISRGGHFAAFEQPELFTAEIRAAFRSLR